MDEVAPAYSVARLVIGFGSHTLLLLVCCLHKDWLLLLGEKRRMNTGGYSFFPRVFAASSILVFNSRSL